MKICHFINVTTLLLFSVMAVADVQTVNLPADNTTLKPSDLPGYQIAVQKCGICHSKDYISYQPPNMSLQQWIGEMHKMHYSYGASIDDDEIKIIGAYLAVTYGSAKADDPAVVAITNLASQIAAKNKNDSKDVQTLLNENGCLACHGIKNRIVGPAYSDVAKKYQGDPNAVTKLQESIVKGVSGMWGNVAMPPMAVSTEEAKTLAEFVLKQ